MLAPPPQANRRASECLASLQNRSPVTLDQGFGEDLLAVLADESIEDRPAWGS